MKLKSKSFENAESYALIEDSNTVNWTGKQDNWFENIYNYWKLEKSLEFSIPIENTRNHLKFLNTKDILKR